MEMRFSRSTVFPAVAGLFISKHAEAAIGISRTHIEFLR
jgi:hypothetical protein